MSATLLLASMAADAAAVPDRVAVPSGVEVWLQEELSDRVPGMGLVQRYRFVMPSLAELVPPMEPDAGLTDLPAGMVDEDAGAGDQPLSPAEQAELDAALGDLVITEVPPDDPADGGAAVASLPGDGGQGGEEIDAPLPSELAAPDPAPDPAAGVDAAPDAEAGGDIAASAGPPGPIESEPPLPEAPDVLMQDPLHRDIVWLCEHFALPRLSGMAPRPTHVVISVASAPTQFGSFDPQVVQLFEGFSIPGDRDTCIWEPI